MSFERLKTLCTSTLVPALLVSVGSVLYMKKPMLSNVSLSDPIRSRIVSVHSKYSEGSGYKINENVVVTAYHVVATIYKSDRFPEIFDGKTEKTYMLRAWHPAKDLAILSRTALSQKDFEDIKNSISTDCLNKPVTSYGFANLDKLRKIDTIIDKLRFKEDTLFLSGPGHLIPGMSGGPLLTKDGKLCGINSAVYLKQSLLSTVMTGKRRYDLYQHRQKSPSLFAGADGLLELIP